MKAFCRLRFLRTNTHFIASYTRFLMQQYFWFKPVSHPIGKQPVIAIFRILRIHVTITTSVFFSTPAIPGMWPLLEKQIYSINECLHGYEFIQAVILSYTSCQLPDQLTSLYYTGCILDWFPGCSWNQNKTTIPLICHGTVQTLLCICFTNTINFSIEVHRFLLLYSNEVQHNQQYMLHNVQCAPHVAK